MARNQADKMTKVEKSWIKYDVGNSAMFMLATALIPIYFNDLVAKAGLGDGSVAMWIWSYGISVATLIVALLMPILGSIADFKDNKRKFFIGFVGTGCVATLVLGIPDNWLPFLIIYVIATIALNSSLVFYDSFLVDATTDERMDRVSNNGYAWGYIGSCIPFLVCVAIFALNLTGVLPIGDHLVRILTFAITAIWWFAFSLPLLRDVHQTHYKEHEPHPVKSAIQGFVRTFKEICKNKPVLFFIIAYFFYIDGVHTIINEATAFGADLGLDSIMMLVALFVTQIVAFPSAIIYGRLCGKFGTRKMILVGIVGYTLITMFAAFFLHSSVEFWILAVCVGMFQGGIQASSRSYFGKLIPKEKSNEYFGSFDIFGKYAAVLGAFLVGIFTQITGSGHMGVLSIAILFIVGFFFLIKMPKTHADDPGEE
ncbi:MAG: MFS transporter [Eggerthellaceae bacterium]|nr:MFS transporter [Eggerthellaceae bacterium]